MPPPPLPPPRPPQRGRLRYRGKRNKKKNPVLQFKEPKAPLRFNVFPLTFPMWLFTINSLFDARGPLNQGNCRVDLVILF